MAGGALTSPACLGADKQVGDWNWKIK